VLKPTRAGRDRRSRSLLFSLVSPDFDPPQCAPVDGKVTLNGISNAGVRIDVYVDDVKVATLSAADNLTGAWSIPTPIAPGSHLLRVEDEHGNSMTKVVEIPDEGCLTLGTKADPVELPPRKNPRTGPKSR
jgi:hypothetical protein